MPMKDDLALVSRQHQCQSNHRIRMVDMDDIIAVADLPEPADNLKREGRSSGLDEGAARKHAGMVIQDDRMALAWFGYRAEHVTINPTAGETGHEVVHYFFNATQYRVELT